MAVYWMVDFIVEAAINDGMETHPFSRYFHENFDAFLEWIDKDLKKEEVTIFLKTIKCG